MTFDVDISQTGSCWHHLGQVLMSFVKVHCHGRKIVAIVVVATSTFWFQIKFMEDYDPGGP